MLKKIVIVTFSFFITYAFSATSEELMTESVAKCKATSSTKATADIIVKKVNEAVALIEKEGEKAFPKFKGKNSDFIFSGTYIFINSMDGIMLMHPIKSSLEGKNTMAFKDPTGKRFIAEFIQKCKAKGEGWVSYLWPKPGEKERSFKSTFVKKAKLPSGREVLVGCGSYDIGEEEFKKLDK